jgi:hypothetical protein
MRLLLRAFVLLLVTLPIAAVTLLALSLQSRPLVADAVRLTPDDVARAKNVFRGHDPRRAGASGLRTISFDEEDLTVTANYLASHLGRGAARVSLKPGEATLQLSLEAPSNPIGGYLNVDAAFGETGALPKLERLRVGSLRVPLALAEPALRMTLQRLTAADAERLATVVRSASFGDRRLTVTYRWSEDTAALARSMLIAPAEQARLRAYHERLADAVTRAPRSPSLAALMPPLFQLAVQRGADGDPLSENRAAIVVLALYATGKPLDRLAGATAGLRSAVRRSPTLAGRQDLAQHFLVSAAIAATAGSPLADAIGLHKEVEDARGGSGFSFNDIGANRAGTRFGEAASRSAPRARELARTVAGGIAESDFMPVVSDLPEHMPEAEFRRRFGGVDGIGYAKMIETIEARLDALPLLRW